MSRPLSAFDVVQEALFQRDVRRRLENERTPDPVHAISFIQLCKNLDIEEAFQEGVEVDKTKWPWTLDRPEALASALLDTEERDVGRALTAALQKRADASAGLGDVSAADPDEGEGGPLDSRQAQQSIPNATIPGAAYTKQPTDSQQAQHCLDDTIRYVPYDNNAQVQQSVPGPSVGVADVSVASEGSEFPDAFQNQEVAFPDAFQIQAFPEASLITWEQERIQNDKGEFQMIDVRRTKYGAVLSKEPPLIDIKDQQPKSPHCEAQAQVVEWSHPRADPSSGVADVSAADHDEGEGGPLVIPSEGQAQESIPNVTIPGEPLCHWSITFDTFMENMPGEQIRELRAMGCEDKDAPKEPYPKTPSKTRVPRPDPQCQPGYYDTPPGGFSAPLPSSDLCSASFMGLDCKMFAS